MNYRRHFSLLGLMSIVLVAVLQMWPLLEVPDHWRVWQLVLFGTLHASAVVGALQRSEPIVKRIFFVAIVACLPVAAFAIGVGVGRLFGGLVFFLMFAFASAIGAASYGLVVRRMWMPQLSIRCVGNIVVACVAATFAALFSAGSTEYFHEWLTLLWWFAFSGGLWFCTGRTANPQT
jgi:hypothetical protein